MVSDYNYLTTVGKKMFKSLNDGETSPKEKHQTFTFHIIYDELME